MCKHIIKENHNYTVMSKEGRTTVDNALKALALADSYFGTASPQAVRMYHDIRVGSFIGIKEYNEDVNGWDGLCDNGFKFENKNKAVTSSPSLTFQDTSTGKLQELQEGVLCTSTGWVNSFDIGYILIGNTANIGDLIIKKFKPESRKSFSITLKECLANGFKIAVGSYDKEKTIDYIKKINKHVGESLTPADILSKRELKQFAQGIAGM